jgi:hypothetical protein
MGEQQGNHEAFTVESLTIERGGVVGQIQFHVTLRRDS